MIIPDLKKSSRSREYNSYSDDQCRQVVKAWLFTVMTHRQIDNKILNLENMNSEGWQSMGILHYLGLTGEFHGLFKDMTVKEAVDAVKSTDTAESKDLLDILMWLYAE